MSKYTEIVILCEDLQQGVFARTFLIKCGIIRQRIRIVPLPAQGGGEGFVRKQFPLEVQAYRRMMNKKNIGLVVMIDADTRSVGDRFSELNQALLESGMDLRKPDDRIGIYVPKRNIETWIYYLKGVDVDEQTAYPHFKNESECKPFVESMADKRNQPLPESAPPSLLRACDELGRILP